MTTIVAGFNVVCINCNAVWAPAAESSLWWQAKKRNERGNLDALPVTGEECGCVKVKSDPDAPYRVFGFDDECRDFDIPFDSFAEAVKEYREASRSMCTVFIAGVSPAVEQRLALL
jgi:hypothetical protein